VFASCDIDCVFDVGANAGQYYGLVRHAVGFRGPIVAFEPLPKMRDILANFAARDPALYVEGCALGAAPGQASFNVMRGSEFSSFLRPIGTRFASSLANNVAVESVTVPVKTLTQVFHEYAGRLGFQRLFLKMDTQGYDLMVLKGGESVLPLIPALQTELSVHSIYENAPDYRHSIDVLESYGYRLSAFLPSNFGHFPRLIDFDAVLVRSDEIERLSATSS
jgi:FkbM family methyltransferase